MRIVSWNAQHGGGRRAARFAETLADFDADAVVITEFRNNSSGKKIIDILQASGIANFSGNNTPAKANTVVIGAKSNFEYANLDKLRGEDHRCVRAQIGSLDLFGLYFPQRHEKVPVFEALCALESSVLESDSLLIGDFNTGRHLLDEVGSTFYGSEYFDRLEGLGWVDAWRSRNPTKSEFSWFSNAGNGFRIDHAFASKSLNSKIRRIIYDHSVREAGTSDHSALVIDIEDV